MYKEILSAHNQSLIGHFLLAVPLKLRSIVIKLAHDIPIAGHFSHPKALGKIQDKYYWPGIDNDVKKYCSSCDLCQRSSVRGRIKQAPLCDFPIVTTPFYKVAIDIVSSISPPSCEKHK